MGLCLGFRLAPHLYLSVPLTHGRRCLAHNGHQGGALSVLGGLAGGTRSLQQGVELLR
jgi:hypothetical protein